jgi:hypothetical protein
MTIKVLEQCVHRQLFKNNPEFIIADLRLFKSSNDAAVNIQKTVLGLIEGVGC